MIVFDYKGGFHTLMNLVLAFMIGFLLKPIWIDGVVVSLGAEITIIVLVFGMILNLIIWMTNEKK
jgi:uncharacterized membrane protein (DUF485 family)